ncbi:MAG: tol-pal system protein YbgF [Deltaproteobacteria bacterium]|nr:tol-pal system protein YbgF [Deltaproteobacteria bacterium]
MKQLSVNHLTFAGKYFPDTLCARNSNHSSTSLQAGFSGMLASLILFLGLFVASCANPQQEQTLKDMKAHMAELEKNQSKTNANMEALNNKFLLLQEQAVISKKDIVELKAMAVPVIPPDNLKVVRLETGDIKKEEVKKELIKKEEIKKTESLPSAEALYNEAQNLFMSGRLSESIDKFAKFILHYPQHTLADNAQYWIGEIYYSQKDYQKALSEFKKAVDSYPNANKASDALLKVAFSYLELNNKEKAMDAFKLLIERYPSSEAAVKAVIKIQELQK